MSNRNERATSSHQRRRSFRLRKTETNQMKKTALILSLSLIISFFANAQKIDRHALVNRHNPVFNSIDSLNTLTVGNGNFAFSVDATGLQTFPNFYEKGISLGTFSNWGWHSFPNPKGYNLSEVTKSFKVGTDSIPYVYLYSKGEKNLAGDYLRQNAHRLHLGLIGYEIRKKNGKLIDTSDVKNIVFKLDMWTGKISSEFTIENEMVKTELFANQDDDQISAKVTSALIAQGRLKISFHFPYGSGRNITGGLDFNHPDSHSTEMIKGNKEVLFKRVLDSIQFFVKASWNETASIQTEKAHQYLLVPDKSEKSFSFSVSFSPKDTSINKNFEETQENNKVAWQKFWESGGAIDFAGSTDPRASELERRVVLSQYLTKIQSSGNLPPQETGLTYNSWYGKFHLEMHWWHGTHFVLWNRPELFANSMDWYKSILPEAKKTAVTQGYDGIRWPKMIAPDGVESPSNIGTFLIWQQPHPIYYAELFYRNNPTTEILERYKEVVFKTADFMASFAKYDESTGFYNLPPPLIPAQESFDAEKTINPSFELAYWYYALNLAQKWRERLGLEENEKWQKVIDKLAPLPIEDSVYIPYQGLTDAYTNKKYISDHPIVTGILGFLPQTKKVDLATMDKTFDKVWKVWNWSHTWGWDYPMAAMSAARLGKPEKAIDALFMNAKANTYLKNGHNYQNANLTIYLPGNGGLLTAVAMMVAGWDGAPKRQFPGFPDNGKWKIKAENLSVMP